MLESDTPHYRNGTAAGHKGNSPEARQNSREAAEMVNKTLGRRQRQVFAKYVRYGASGANPEQIAEDLELPLHVVRPRVGELVKLGKIHEIGKRMGGLGCNVMARSVEPPKGGEA